MSGFRAHITSLAGQSHERSHRPVSRFGLTPIARVLLCAGLGAGGSMASAVALAQSAETNASASALVAFEIPAGSLDSALRRVGRQANVMIAVDASLTAGKRAPALNASLPIDLALKVLLSGSGLEAVRSADDGYAVRASEAPAPTTAPAGGAVMMKAVTVTAEAEARQALGSSVITSEDIERLPPANDLSQILRTMPGVNLTGNSASGQYGNNRQIDLRGMGPENTLILIDGKQVNSRDAVRMGRSGERNTRGDTNWVPAEAVERIEVLRGPAAARYGSGASGGVINIITKKPGDEFSGSMTLYSLVPEHNNEGGSDRVGFQVSGPAAKDLAFRLFGNINRTDADSLSLNRDYATEDGATPPAGREGVRNRDISGFLRWDATEKQVFELEAAYSRQGNIYAGDRAVSGAGSDLLTQLAEDGAETNTMYRRSGSLTHRGKWDIGDSRLSFAYEHTDNKRLNEGLAGSSEGSINTETSFSTSELQTYDIDGELNMPLAWGGYDQMMTLGFELRDSRLDDPFSVTQSTSNGGSVPGADEGRDGKADAQNAAAFVEHNLYIGEEWVITPGLRFDHHSQFGNNLSPSLNAQYHLTDTVSLKGGAARAFKAPNLYQSNPNYLYYTMGNGCPYDPLTGGTTNQGAGCYVQGNADLDAETSLNKELGIEWSPQNGFGGSLTYFHNDYKNKIVAGVNEVGQTDNSASGNPGLIFQWTNAPKAIVQGFEGHFNVPLLGDRGDKLQWRNNLTYMIENENTETKQPLSVIPDYTLNSTLDYRFNAQWSFLLLGTFYGKQESATLSNTTEAPIDGDTRGAYSTWGLSGRCEITPKTSVTLGVNNVFDKRLFREGTNNSGGVAGAATYNEPGRAFYASLVLGF